MKAEEIKIGKVVNVKGHNYRNGKRFSGFVTRKDAEGFTLSTNNRRTNVYVEYGSCETWTR